MVSLLELENSLFPLPLVPFELLLLFDDRESHPMTCGAEFTFDGTFSRPRLASAVEQAVARHPLFAARIESGPYGRLHWVRGGEIPEIRWLNEKMPFTCQSPARVDLFREPGLRIKAYESTRQTRLVFEFHHACSDGAGGLTFVEDILAIYANACISKKVAKRELPPMHFRSLKTRGNFSGAYGLSWSRLKNEWNDVAETLRFFCRRPTAIAQVSPRLFGGVEDASTGRVGNVLLDATETSRMRRMALDAGGTINDLLICSLLQAIRDWNVRCGSTNAHETYRIMLPWNMRTRSELEMPATNFMSLAFLQRSGAQLQDYSKLLSSIAAETNHIRQRGVPARVLSKLGILRYIPGAYPFLLNRETCHATAVLSNVGDPTRRFRTRFPRERGNIVAGDVMLTDFQALSPIRPHTHASFFVHTYAQRLSITAWLSAARFASAEAQQFVRMLLERLDPHYQARHDSLPAGLSNPTTNIKAAG